MILELIQEIPKELPESFNKLLWWIIGVLIVVIGTFFGLLRSLYSSKIKDLKESNSRLESMLNEELKYNREQDKLNIQAITNSANSQNELAKSIERVLAMLTNSPLK